MKFFRPHSGDTIVEVAIALAILSVVLTSAYNVATLSYRVGASSRERTEAISIAQQQAEMLRQFRDAAQADSTGAHGIYPITLGSPWHMDNSGALITPIAGENNIPGTLYYYGISNGPSPVPAPAPIPGGINLALNNYVVTVHWKPAVGDASGTDTHVNLLFSLADRRNFVLKPCEDATVPACSNLVYP